MLKQIKSSMREDANSLGFSRAVKHIKSSLLVLSAASILSACVSPSDHAEPRVELDSSAGETYVAFAGGGWRAHTGHSAWMVGLLDNDAGAGYTSLDTAFKNVSGISSNSGGSWFNVMLSYSDNFRAGLEKPYAGTQYLTDASAYYANEKALYNNLSTVDLSPLCKLSNDFSNMLAMACLTDLNWDNLVEDIVFGPLNLADDLDNVTMDGPQAWGARKTIALAATALSGEVVLAENGFFEDYQKFYYDAPNMGPLLVTPVTFAGKAQSWHPTPRFFPGGSGSFDLGYSDTASWDSELAEGNLRTVEGGSINVVNAAAGSSAAIGFLSSKAINDQNKAALADVRLLVSDWEISYDARHLSVYFNLPNPKTGANAVTRSVITPKADSHLNATGRFIKIGDGGALDNSGVAHSVLIHQQKYHPSTPFEIIAFDNVQRTYSYTPTALEAGATPATLINQVGIDIAFLFGRGDTIVPGTTNTGMCMDSYCVTTNNGTVSQQIFDATALNNPPVWRWTSGGTYNSAPCELIYTPYDVTTLENEMMGIKGGYTGTLHSFTANCPSAKTAPFKKDEWAAYEDMFNAIQTGLDSGGGLAYLRAAFE